MRGRKPRNQPELRVVGANYDYGGAPAVAMLLEPPESMPAAQAEVWRFMAANAPRGHLSAVDAPLLGTLCDVIVAYDRSVERALDEPMLVKGERGLVFNPSWRAALRFQAATIRALEALALTPATITRARPRK